jgi:hypothetical protein
MFSPPLCLSFFTAPAATHQVRLGEQRAEALPFLNLCPVEEVDGFAVCPHVLFFFVLLNASCLVCSLNIGDRPDGLLAFLHPVAKRVPRLDGEAVGQVLIVIPSSKIQNEIVEEVNRRRRMAKALLDEANNLSLEPVPKLLETI